MKQIDRAYVESNKDEVISAIKAGKIFIYPTDTIYGIGCDATNNDAVMRVRAIKQRPDNPFSSIAPSKQWILEKCVVPDSKELDRLPGPFTFILKPKDVYPLAPMVNPTHTEMGIRIPDHWFTSVISEAGVPFVTTSVNYSGEKHMESLEEVPKEILDQVDYVIYEGVKKGQSSAKINLT